MLVAREAGACRVRPTPPPPSPHLLPSAPSFPFRPPAPTSAVPPGSRRTPAGRQTAVKAGRSNGAVKPPWSNRSNWGPTAVRHPWLNRVVRPRPKKNVVRPEGQTVVKKPELWSKQPNCGQNTRTVVKTPVVESDRQAAAEHPLNASSQTGWSNRVVKQGGQTESSHAGRLRPSISRFPVVNLISCGQTDFQWSNRSQYHNRV